MSVKTQEHDKTMAKQAFYKGDTVEWSSGQGASTGTVQKRVTESTEVDGSSVKASSDDPRYLVENDNTGNVTGHKPEALSKTHGSDASAPSDESNDSGNSFKKGDKVKWNTSQGKTTGTVKKKLTEDTEIKDFDVKASKDNPKYLVESEKTGAQAAHKPESLDSAE